MKNEDFSPEYVDELKQLLKTGKATVLYHNAIYEVRGEVLIDLLKKATNCDHEYWYMSRDNVKMRGFRV